VPVPRAARRRRRRRLGRGAAEIGLPVVVKPQDGNQGKGVTVNIDHARAARSGLRQGRRISGDVMVERFMPGHDFRLLVVGDRWSPPPGAIRRR
jgi:cyanophycin synthetase